MAGLEESNEGLSRESGFGLLFDASPVPTWVYDAETLEFLAVNDAAVRHYGWSREEFLSMRITEIRPADDVELLLRSLQGGSVGRWSPEVWRHRRRDGSIIDVEITAGRIVLAGRDAALVVARDVTERRKLEERLVEAEKMEAIGRLAGGVAHDFNNLLTVIAGYAAILRETPGAGEPLDEIEHAAEQATALTRQLLEFSRRQVLHPQAVDVNEIVGAMGPMLERIIGDDVQVAVRLAGSTAPVEADRAQIERVVLNLAANARDAMPNGGQLTIQTANVELDESYVAGHGEVTPGPHVLLAISDSGGGTGLGLATVFGVVKQSGGSIFVYSEEGRGTTFKIYLPATDRPVQAPQNGDRPATERGSETVVVVEDDASVRELVRIMLGDCGYAVLAAADADEAMALCTEQPGGVQLLLTDVVMPDVGGRVLAERLSALFPRLPCCSCPATPTRRSSATGSSGRARRSSRSRSPRPPSRARCARCSTPRCGSRARCPPGRVHGSRQRRLGGVTGVPAAAALRAPLQCRRRSEAPLRGLSGTASRARRRLEDVPLRGLSGTSSACVPGGITWAAYPGSTLRAFRPPQRALS